MRVAPPFQVEDYVRYDKDMLDDLRFKYMCILDFTEEIKNCLGIFRYTTVGGSVKRWNYWGGCVFSQVEIPHDDFYMPFVSCYEEDNFDRNIGDLFHSLEYPRYSGYACHLSYLPMSL